MISALPTGATRKSVRVCSSVVMRRPLKTRTLKSTSADATANAEMQMQREHPVDETHGARLAHPGAGLKAAGEPGQSSCQTGAW